MDTGAPNKTSNLRQLAGLVKTHGALLLRRRPQLVPKLAVNFLRINAFDHDVMRTASISVEHRCNAACDHCSADKIMDEGKRDARRGQSEAMTLPELRRALDGFLRAGAVSVNITGGEPLLSPDLFDIIAAVPRWRGVVNIQTNGLLLDAAMARRLADAGVYIAMISCHSHKPEAHDAFLRVPGAWNKVMAAIDHCHDVGMPVILNCTLTHEKVQDGTLWEMVRLARDKDVTLNFVQPCTTGKWEQHMDVRLTEDDYAEFDKAMRLPWVVWEGKSNYKHNGCSPGIERVYVSADGDVTPCAFIHLNFGNIKRESVATIWGRLRNFEAFQQPGERCMASNDEAFYREYVQQIAQAGKPTLPIEEHPSYRAEHPDEAEAIVR
jgi:AdoMet-dependent heme synthase